MSRACLWDWGLTRYLIIESERSITFLEITLHEDKTRLIWSIFLLPKEAGSRAFYFIALQSWMLWVACREIIINATCFAFSGKIANCWHKLYWAVQRHFCDEQAYNFINRFRVSKKFKIQGFCLKTVWGHWLIWVSVIPEKFPILLLPLRRDAKRRSRHQKESDTDQQPEVRMLIRNSGDLKSAVLMIFLSPCWKSRNVHRN